MSRIRQIFVFLSIFALILFMSHFYMFDRLSYYLQLDERQKTDLALLSGGMPALTLIALPLSRALPRAAASILAWVFYPWMGIALLLFATLLTTDVVWLLLHLIASSDLPAQQASLQHCFGILAVTIASVLVSFSLWKGLSAVTIKPLTIVLDKLPASLDGLRIVQLTDLHIGPLIDGKWLRRVVDQVNALNPDLVVITGDLVDGSVDELRAHVAPIADLKTRYGTFFITGNHEYYSGVEQWCAHLNDLGIRVLRNQRVSITAGSTHDSFDLAGVNDWASTHFPGGGADLPQALGGRDMNKVLVLLAHQPAAADEAAAHGVDLQLSGHTHGGQIWPFTYLVYLQQPYAQGLYRHGDSGMQIYVSAGTGFWGPPMRLGTTAEITHITLRVPT